MSSETVQYLAYVLQRKWPSSDIFLHVMHAPRHKTKLTSGYATKWNKISKTITFTEIMRRIATSIIGRLARNRSNKLLINLFLQLNWDGRK